MFSHNKEKIFPVYLQKKGKRRFAKICFLYDLPVPGHEDQGKDGDVGRDVDDVLDCPAPGQPEGPEHEDVVTGRGRDTDLRQSKLVFLCPLLLSYQYKEKICHGQVQYKKVGRVLHLRVLVDLRSQ